MRNPVRSGRAVATVVGIAVIAVGGGWFLAAGSGTSLDDAAPSTAPHDRSRPVVFAAASLSESFPRIHPEADFSFAGSQTLAFQIRQGAPADVFASASPVDTQALYREGLIEKPRTLVFNRLVMITPRSNPARLRRVFDVNRDGVKLVVANDTVPVGAYTRTVLRNLGLSRALRNVVSQEADVKGVVGKVALGEADAGFVYVTDARAAGRSVARFAIPTFAQPTVRYEIAVLRRSRNLGAARAFVAKTAAPRGRAVLKAAGFRLPAASTPASRAATGGR